ncbi:MAG: hypothetical protein HWE33_10130 [Rhodobacteraceae bacterium]|nr:hypothetical protein [Paracoccaceae bacterium]
MAPTRHTPEESVTKLRQLAAHFGLPYVFASHFAPDMLEEALHVYRINV